MMASRGISILSALTALALIAIGALHGSGYAYAARSIEESELPVFLKQILPPLYLYPSVLMILLALVVILSLWQPKGRPFLMCVLSGLVAANALLGFLLGGIVPGAVLLLVAGLLLLIARLAARMPSHPGRS